MWGMDSFLPSTAQDLVPAIVACKQALNQARANLLHKARDYRKDPTPEGLEDVACARVLLSYREDDLAALMLELATRMGRHH